MEWLSVSIFLMGKKPFQRFDPPKIWAVGGLFLDDERTAGLGDWAAVFRENLSFSFEKRALRLFKFQKEKNKSPASAHSETGLFERSFFASCRIRTNWSKKIKKKLFSPMKKILLQRIGSALAFFSAFLLAFSAAEKLLGDQPFDVEKVLFSAASLAAIFWVASLFWPHRASDDD